MISFFGRKQLEKITWESKIIDIDKFTYNNKELLRKRLFSRFGEFDFNQPYFLKGPEKRYCIAFKVEPIYQSLISFDFPKKDG